MTKNQIIRVVYKEQEIGKLGYDSNRRVSTFQYHEDFLSQEPVPNLFPYIFRKVKNAQVFSNYEGEAFRGLPPMIADSLPDFFGNRIFQEWLEAQNLKIHQLNPLEQLTYVGNRGMGALEYQPIKNLDKNVQIDLNQMSQIAQKILESKFSVYEKKLDEQALFNIFRLGTSAGGARPKILVSQDKETGALIPGDIETSDKYRHLIIKLAIDDKDYHQEKIEFLYYKMATRLGIEMMPSKLIDDKHFATERFDRQEGKKIHVLTASGLTGWDFKLPDNSSYENLFELALDLNLPHKDIRQLFKRMVFNVVFGNTDDHLKNFSFIFNDSQNSWGLAPAYDLTFAMNPLLNFIRISRACSINGKRTDIQLKDILALSERFSINNPTGIIENVMDGISQFRAQGESLKIKSNLLDSIEKNFVILR